MDQNDKRNVKLGFKVKHLMISVQSTVYSTFMFLIVIRPRKYRHSWSDTCRFSKDRTSENEHISKKVSSLIRSNQLTKVLVE